MSGFYKRVIATHVIYNNQVYDIDTFVTNVTGSGGSTGLTLLKNNTTDIPIGEDLVLDMATTANLATGVLSLSALSKIPDDATHVLIRVRAHMNNASGIVSRCRLTLSGLAATSHPTMWKCDITNVAQDLPTHSSLHWVDVQVGGGGAYPGINWQFEKGGTPQGFFNIQVIGYNKA